MKDTSSAKGWISKKMIASLGITALLVIIGTVTIPQFISDEGPSDGLPKEEGVDAGKGHTHGEVISNGASIHLRRAR